MISDAAIHKILTAVNKEKSVNADTVSGASLTSNALLDAIKIALREAGGDDRTFASDERAVLTEKEEELEQSFDIVIVGAGGAGLSAAVETQTAGAKVIVLEKNPSVGRQYPGIRGWSECSAGSDQQKLNSVEDSVELFVQDTLKGGDYKGNEALVRVVADGALNAARWLIEDLGVQFMPDRLQQFDGHSVPRALIAKGNLAQTGSTAYLVWGNEIESVGQMTEIHSDEYSLMEKDDLVFRADSLEELADHLGLDTAAGRQQQRRIRCIMCL